MDPFQVRSFATSPDEVKNKSPDHHFSTKPVLSSSDEPKSICRTLSNDSADDTKYFSMRENVTSELQHVVDSSTEQTIRFENQVTESVFNEFDEMSPQSGQLNAQLNTQDNTAATGFDPFISNLETDPFNSNIQSDSLSKEFLKEDDPFSSGFFNIGSCSKLEDIASFGDCKPSFTSQAIVEETQDPIREVDCDESRVEESGIEQFEKFENSEIQSMESNLTYLEPEDLEEQCIFTRKSGQLENIPENDQEISDDIVYVMEDELTDEEKKEVEHGEDNQRDQDQGDGDSEKDRNEVLKPIAEISHSGLVSDEFVNNAEKSEQTSNLVSNEQVDNSDDDKVDDTLENCKKVQEPHKRTVESDEILKWRVLAELKIKNKDKDEVKSKDELLEQAKREREDWYSTYKYELKLKKNDNRTSEEDLINGLRKNETSKSWARIVEMCDFGYKHSPHLKDTTRLRSVLLELKNSTANR